MSSGYHRLGANVAGKSLAWDNRAMPIFSGASPPATMVEAKAKNHDAARQLGYTGDSCSQCSSTRMRIAGHCQVCDECGTTTGCS